MSTSIFTFMEKLTQIYASIAPPKPTSTESKVAKPGYNVAPCALCPDMISSREIRESVMWAEGTSYGWFFDGHDFLAHRRCWKALSEAKRNQIRNKCPRDSKPRALGQTA